MKTKLTTRPSSLDANGTLNLHVPHSWSELTQEQLRLSFSSPLEVLKHLKETGVTGTAAQPWTRGRLQEFCRNYTGQFSDERGKVYLTFHPIYMVCRK
jgi:hypothetical protein